jgi:hypothetical protein
LSKFKEIEKYDPLVKLKLVDKPLSLEELDWQGFPQLFLILLIFKSKIGLSSIYFESRPSQKTKFNSYDFILKTGCI